MISQQNSNNSSGLYYRYVPNQALGGSYVDIYRDVVPVTGEPFPVFLSAAGGYQATLIGTDIYPGEGFNRSSPQSTWPDDIYGRDGSGNFTKGNFVQVQQQTTTTTVIPNNTVVIPNIVVPPPPPPPPIKLAPGRVYTQIPEMDRLPVQKITQIIGSWPHLIGNQTTFVTGSTFHSGSYKLSILGDSGSCNLPLFDIYYGHKDGSGSKDTGGNDWFTPSKAIYGQYRNLCNDNATNFYIGARELKSIYVVKIKNDYTPYDHLQLNLRELSGSGWEYSRPRNAFTGSNIRLGLNNKSIKLIEDKNLNYSVLNSTALDSDYSDVHSSLVHRVNTNGNYHYIVSGTLESGISGSDNPQVYGLAYPKIGVIILDADRLDRELEFLTITGSDTFGDNPRKLFTSISGSALLSDNEGTLGFKLRTETYKYVEQYFVRVKNYDYNYSNNPTYTTGSEGDINPDFTELNRVYYSQIGLYNDNKELIAVGKLTRPILKDFVTEGLFTLKLEY